MVKIYLPPSQRSSSEFIRASEEKVPPVRLRPKREVVRRAEKDALEPLLPAMSSSEFVPGEDEEMAMERSKVFCMLPPSMQRQNVVQKSRKWGLVPPSLVRQSRGEREVKRGNEVNNNNDDEVRDDSANVNWLFNARQGSKDSPSQEQREQLAGGTTPPPWLARLIRIQHRSATAESSSGTKTNAGDSNEEKEKVSENPSSWFPNLNVSSENDMYAFSMLHQLLDDPWSSACLDASCSASSPLSFQSSPSDSSELVKRKVTFFTLSKWLSEHQKGKMAVVVPPPIAHSQQAENSDKMAPAIAPWFKTWIESHRGQAKAKRTGDLKATPRQSPPSVSSSTPAPTSTDKLDQEDEGNTEPTTTAADAANVWFSKWIQSLPTNLTSVDASVTDKNSFLPRPVASSAGLQAALCHALPTNDADEVVVVEMDPFAWIDRYLPPIEFVLPAPKKPYEPVDDDDDDDDLEPIDSDEVDEDDDYFSYRLKEDFNVQPIVQEKVKVAEACVDEQSVASTKSVKRVRFNLGDDEHKWRE